MEESPEGARIMALADAWDVMTTERPYTSAPSTPAEAIAECRACAGTQFWPPAVEALQRLRGGGVTPPGRRLALAAVGVAGLAVAGLLGLAVALNGEDEPARPGLRVVVEPAGVVTSGAGALERGRAGAAGHPGGDPGGPARARAQRTVTPVAPRVVVDRAPETDPGDATAPLRNPACARSRVRSSPRLGATPPPAVVAPPPVAPLVAPSTPVVDPQVSPTAPVVAPPADPPPVAEPPVDEPPPRSHRSRSRRSISPRWTSPRSRSPRSRTRRSRTRRRTPTAEASAPAPPSRIPAGRRTMPPWVEGRGPGLSRGCRPAALPREEPGPSRLVARPR